MIYIIAMIALLLNKLSLIERIAIPLINCLYNSNYSRTSWSSHKNNNSDENDKSIY